MCGGLNAPPRTPIAPTWALLASDLPVAVHDVLEGGELAEPDRPSRMQLLRRVPDFRPHAELEAIGEARGRIHVDDRGVDAVSELKGRFIRRCDDRLGVPSPVPIHVID